jgi:hypothetical protein
MIEHTKGVIRQTDNTIEKRLNIPKEQSEKTDNTIEKRLNIPKE